MPFNSKLSDGDRPLKAFVELEVGGALKSRLTKFLGALHASDVGATGNNSASKKLSDDIGTSSTLVFA